MDFTSARQVGQERCDNVAGDTCTRGERMWVLPRIQVNQPAPGVAQSQGVSLVPQLAWHELARPQPHCLDSTLCSQARPSDHALARGVRQHND